MCVLLCNEFDSIHVHQSDSNILRKEEEMTNKQNNHDASHENNEPIRTSFTDTELNDALAGFEREFKEDAANTTDNTKSKNSQNNSENHEDAALDEAMRNIEEATFEEDLQGLLGNKAKVAMIVTYVTPAQLLAAFCKMVSVSAQCFDEEQGAVAVLKHLNNNEPEEAVQKFVDFFRGMDVMLITNRADKLTAKVYEYSVEPQDIVAPMALAVWSRTVEDLAICMEDVNSIVKQGVKIFDSDDFSDGDAIRIFQKYGNSNKS